MKIVTGALTLLILAITSQPSASQELTKVNVSIIPIIDAAPPVRGAHVRVLQGIRTSKSCKADRWRCPGIDGTCCRRCRRGVKQYRLDYPGSAPGAEDFGSLLQ